MSFPIVHIVHSVCSNVFPCLRGATSEVVQLRSCKLENWTTKNTSVCSVCTVFFKTLGLATGAQPDAVPLPERWSMEMDEVVSTLVVSTRETDFLPRQPREAGRCTQEQRSTAVRCKLCQLCCTVFPLLPH